MPWLVPPSGCGDARGAEPWTSAKHGMIRPAPSQTHRLASGASGTSSAGGAGSAEHAAGTTTSSSHTNSSAGPDSLQFVRGVVAADPGHSRRSTPKERAAVRRARLPDRQS